MLESLPERCAETIVISEHVEKCDWLEILADWARGQKKLFHHRRLKFKTDWSVFNFSLFHQEIERKLIRFLGAAFPRPLARSGGEFARKGILSTSANNHASSRGAAENKRHRIHVLRGKCALAYEILIALFVQVLASFIRSPRADCYGRCCCSRSCSPAPTVAILTPRNFAGTSILRFSQRYARGGGIALCCRSQNGIFVPLSARCTPRHDRFSRITLVSHRRFPGIMSEYTNEAKSLRLLFLPLSATTVYEFGEDVYDPTESMPRKNEFEQNVEIRSEMQRASCFFLINRQP